MMRKPEANPMEELRNNLWKHAMQGKWDEVITLYDKYPEAQTLEVMKSRETALHMAIADEQEDVVEKLVQRIAAVETLRKKNKLGDTALHLAAHLGSVRMCRSITGRSTTLLAERSKGDETPLFVAAKHGRKEAFLCMYEMCSATERERQLLHYKYSREGRTTVLHVAISGEHFDLAYQIIHLYPKQLINRFDNWGFLPLHLLAMKPTVFKSGCSMGLLHRLVYSCIRVKKLEIENKSSEVQEKVDEENPPIYGPCPGLVPKNSGSRFGFVTLISKAIGAILWTFDPIYIVEKKKHTWSVQIMNALLEKSKDYSYTILGRDIRRKTFPTEVGNKLMESPLLMAAKYGILEMVEKILENNPVAIHDINLERKNIVLVAVENRQPHIYQFVLDKKHLTNTIFHKTDKDNNSALHLAAILSDQHERNWNIPGPAQHMQWEIKWYQYVEKSMPPGFFVLHNKNYETPWSIFRDKHKVLVVEAGKWLSKAFDSSCIVTILIATVSFAGYATVPGGLNSNTGRPVLQRDAVFNLFAISSLIALCCSISSVIMFLVFFTSKYREIDFARNLPMMVLVELSSLMVAIAALLVSFCAAHSFVIKDSLKYTVFPLYAVTLLPVAVYAFWQVPHYFEMAYATIHHRPQRIYPQ